MSALLIACAAGAASVQSVKAREVRNLIRAESQANVIIRERSLDFGSLTLRQKLAQMIVVRGDSGDLLFTNLGVGGIFLDRQNTAEQYRRLIRRYQEHSRISLFVATDMEGAWNPFPRPGPGQQFPRFDEIATPEQAYRVGRLQGELLRETGFNLNFSPVAELTDRAYGGRAFNGSVEEVKEKLRSYVEGLQENVLGTCKHYPGRSMLRNLHLMRSRVSVTRDNLDLFDVCFQSGIAAVMVGHQMVEGAMDSGEVPATVSAEVLRTLRGFAGLIVADEINMYGLHSYYERAGDVQKYADLINAGQELILDFSHDAVSLFMLIEELEQAVLEGVIDRGRVDRSAGKILYLKGYRLVNGEDFVLNEGDSLH
jgi:beta-N-acetylhexosaminidase